MTKLNESDLACQVIREEIDQLDEYLAKSEEEDKKERTVIGTHHVSLGSPSPITSLQGIEQDFNQDIAFTDFRRKLSRTLSTHLQFKVQLHADNLVCPPFHLRKLQNY